MASERSPNIMQQAPAAGRGVHPAAEDTRSLRGARRGEPTRVRGSRDRVYGLQRVPRGGGHSRLFIVKAINEIEDVYIKWLDIKRLRTELAEKGTAVEHLSGIDQHINETVDQRLTELAHELVEESALPDEHRSNELENQVRWSLRRLAERIDQGYSVDVRAPEPPAEELADEEGSEEDEAAVSDRARLMAIRELAANIRRLDPQGKRILQLPGGDETDPAADE
jgi:hypothetical protein